MILQMRDKFETRKNTLKDDVYVRLPGCSLFMKNYYILLLVGKLVIALAVHMLQISK